MMVSFCNLYTNKKFSN